MWIFVWVGCTWLGGLHPLSVPLQTVDLDEVPEAQTGLGAVFLHPDDDPDTFLWACPVHEFDPGDCPDEGTAGAPMTVDPFRTPPLSGNLFDVLPDAGGPLYADCVGPLGCPGPRLAPPVTIALFSVCDIHGDRQHNWREMPNRLRRYCLRRLADDEYDTRSFALPDASGEGLGLVVASQGTSDPVRTDMRATFRARTHAAVALRAPVLDNPASGPAVRLTLLDTVATGAWGSAAVTNSHGDQLLASLSTLLQGDTSWLELRHRMGMPVRNGSRVAPKEPHMAGKQIWNVSGTGDLGALDYLAQAIVREVRSWEEDDTAPPRLVLNLSLAWHPIRDVTPDGRGPVDFGLAQNRDEWRYDVQAVHDALEYARCRGALVVAAAGNRTGGAIDQHGESVGLDPSRLLPAAWADDEVDCSGLAPFGEDEGGSVSEGEPLLWVVGGINHTLEKVALARPGQTPPLNAYADHFLGDSKDAVHPLTGTSVASVIVSAAAAAVWTERPDCTPSEVMDLVTSDHTCTLPFSFDDEHPSTPPKGPARAVAWGGGANENNECVAIDAARFGVSFPRRHVPSDPREVTLITEQEVAATGAPGSSYSPWSTPTPTSAGCPLCKIDPTSSSLTVILADLPFAEWGITEYNAANPRLWLHAAGPKGQTQWYEQPATAPENGSLVNMPVTIPPEAEVMVSALLTFESEGVTFVSEVAVQPPPL